MNQYNYLTRSYLDRSIKKQIIKEDYGLSIDYKPYTIFSIDTFYYVL